MVTKNLSTSRQVLLLIDLVERIPVLELFRQKTKDL